jgi:hypothetical protein
MSRDCDDPVISQHESGRNDCFQRLQKKVSRAKRGFMKRRRTISDLTVADLRALGLSHSFISRLRNRLCRPSLPVAVEIERTYGIPPRAWLEPAQ